MWFEVCEKAAAVGCIAFSGLEVGGMGLEESVEPVHEQFAGVFTGNGSECNREVFVFALGFKGDSHLTILLSELIG
ncbi:hypothetical protein KS4_33180 [Poriferisphaera corsica]|uniref:Uncharacterized protein n=1 Tax=Poriferisphaera corsica TaxID=2528020 RepID=A0A517YYG3_9BACT|nr:hypothetical protein KS4_33180 [Poriferisphaera corsica]